MQKKTSAQKNQLAAEPASPGLVAAVRDTLLSVGGDLDPKPEKWYATIGRREFNRLAAALASRREGEPRRWVAGHTDQHVVHPDPWKPGMNFVVQSREAAEDLARILNAQPPSADLVAAAREGCNAIAEVGMTARLYGRQHQYLVEPGAMDSLGKAHRRLAALQNTPEPDESEAVKLRELLHEAITLIGRWGALPMGSIPPVELTHNSAKFALRGAIALSNTPEVDNAE